MNIDKMIEKLEEWQSEDQRDGFCPITYYALRAILLAGKEPSQEKQMVNRYSDVVFSIRELNKKMSALEERMGTSNMKQKVATRFESIERRVSELEQNFQDVDKLLTCCDNGMIGQEHDCCKKDAPAVKLTSKPTGICSKHRDIYPLDCRICFPVKPSPKTKCNHEYTNNDALVKGIHHCVICGVNKPVTPSETSICNECSEICKATHPRKECSFFKPLNDEPKDGKWQTLEDVRIRNKKIRDLICDPHCKIDEKVDYIISVVRSHDKDKISVDKKIAEGWVKSADYHKDLMDEIKKALEGGV